MTAISYQTSNLNFTGYSFQLHFVQVLILECYSHLYFLLNRIFLHFFMTQHDCRFCFWRSYVTMRVRGQEKLHFSCSWKFYFSFWNENVLFNNSGVWMTLKHALFFHHQLLIIQYCLGPTLHQSFARYWGYNSEQTQMCIKRRLIHFLSAYMNIMKMQMSIHVQ